MATLKTPHISTDMFTYSGKTKTFAAEMSDFGPSGLPFGRVFDDACDEGFTLMNPATKGTRAFCLFQTHIDREGDVTHWEYRELNEKSGRLVENGLKVVIFND